MSLSEAKRLYKQGQQKLATGDLQGAIDKFEQALQFYPNDYASAIELAHVMMELKRYGEAIQYCDRSLIIRADYHQALHIRGLAFYELGQYEKSLDSLNAAQESNPRCASGWRSHGNALHMLKQFSDAIKSFDKALELDCKDFIAWGNRGAALYEIRAYEKALESVHQALELQPDNDYYQLTDNDYYQLIYGLALHGLQRYEKALENFNYILKRNPQYQYAWHNKGVALTSLEQYSEALVSLEKAIEIDSNYSPFWISRAHVLIKLKKYEDALASYGKALNFDPNSDNTWEFRGFTLDDLGRYEEAIGNYDEAIRINPSFFRAWNNRGSSLNSLAQYEQALESFIQASQIDPQQPTAWLGQGDALYDLGRFQEALEAYERTLNIDPSNPSVWISKGRVLRRQNLLHEAISACKKALSLNNQLPFAWINLALAMWDTQGFEAAIEKLDEPFYKLQPTSLNYPEICGRLYHWKGFVYYQEGRKREDCLGLWRKAANCYQMALKSFEQAELQEDYLETLQSLTKVFLGLGQVEKAEVLLAEGTERLKRLLEPEKTPSSGKRRLLSLKFAGFDQLTVDRQIQAANSLLDDETIKTSLRAALETAEKGKNACLSWLLGALNHTASLDYEAMQQLLTPKTAIAYWHLSPAALTTFVLKLGESAPILITQPSTNDRPGALQQLLKLEAWMKEWDDQYRDYRNKDKEQRNADHSWRKDMTQRLFERQEEPGNLKEILNIAAIEPHLGGIEHLILVPHRDLHRFPLHALFSDRFTTSYLPSLQVGLNLKERQPARTNCLLSIENPTSDRSTPLEFARVESQIISQTFQNVNLIQETEATQRSVMDALNEGYNVLHFSGHGSHHPENPQRSELLLAGADGLTLQEICQCDLTRYDLISLSACETGLTTHQSIATEYVGLVSGFLYSGAAQVISTLWVVESAVSALVMIEFYRRRSVRSDVIALAETIQWLKGLTRSSFAAWHAERLAELPSTLSRERRARIKRTLDHALARWGTIEQDIRNPYSWASFTLSGGFFS